MRYVYRFLDLATFDPQHIVLDRQRLLARILLDTSITALWFVVKQIAESLN